MPALALDSAVTQSATSIRRRQHGRKLHRLAAALRSVIVDLVAPIVCFPTLAGTRGYSGASTLHTPTSSLKFSISSVYHTDSTSASPTPVNEGPHYASQASVRSSGRRSAWSAPKTSASSPPMLDSDYAAANQSCFLANNREYVVKSEYPARCYALVIRNARYRYWSVYPFSDGPNYSKVVCYLRLQSACPPPSVLTRLLVASNSRCPRHVGGRLEPSTVSRWHDFLGQRLGQIESTQEEPPGASIAPRTASCSTSIRSSRR